MRKVIRVFVVGAGGLAEAGLAFLCKAVPRVEVLTESFSDADALESVATLRPDIVFVDTRTTPNVSVFDVVKTVQERRLSTRVILVTDNADPRLLRRAIDAGVAGYLLHYVSEGDEVGRAIRAVAKGHIYVTPPLTRDLIRTSSLDAETTRLTSRLREILELLLEGRTNKEIAGMLNLSVRTVEDHCGELMKRLGYRNRINLIVHGRNGHQNGGSSSSPDSTT